MKKIISLYARNYEGDHQVRNEIVPGAEWVIAGEGVATRKMDGTCCLFEAGIFYKRYDAKQGKKPPFGFKPAQEPDPITGHWPGWVPVDSDRPEDKYHAEARAAFGKMHEGTYELCGPKINANREKLDRHQLIEHASLRISYVVPRDFEGLKEFLSKYNIEGIVWHHPDGRMVKIKGKDFGIKRT